MTLRRTLIFAALFLSTAALVADDAADRLFLERVKPLLESRCLSCHGPEKPKGALRLDSRAAALKGGEKGPAVVLGKPEESFLLQAVLHQKKDLEMPPKEKKLPAADIVMLEKWIRAGAPWPKVQLVSAPSDLPPKGEHLGNAWSDPRNPIVRIFGGERLDLWSLQPIKQSAPPHVTNEAWVWSSIDRFILARLEAAGSIPAPEADRRSLARRLYFDLTGVPPTVDEVQRFIGDQALDAYERLVERLLASPSYGEHWARLWLDVVRYSDSNGFDWDEFRPRAWRFRDYVIRSLNTDKPFNQFIVEQLAGDEMLSGPPRTIAEQDALIATGYLRLGPHDNSAGSFNEQGRSRAELMADLTETTGSAFLGLTMSCCRCHDHKFDPISQADHYRLRAFFAPVKFSDEVPLDLAADQVAIRQHNESIEAEVKPVREQREQLLEPVKSRLRNEHRAKLTAEESALLDLPADKQSEQVQSKLKELRRKVDPAEKEVQGALTAEEKERHQMLSKELTELQARTKPYTTGLLMTDSDEAPPVTRILFQGDYKQERDPVAPGFLSILDPNPAVIEKTGTTNTTGRRLTLARWITSRSNPLTARVAVNRVWQGHFGRGLVTTPNDFGLAGARPTHPELLDWLATYFVEEGWSLKKLHRLIVNSATYRQASSASGPLTAAATAKGGGSSSRSFAAAVPASDELFGGQSMRRLSAEQLRDALLSVAGLLRERAGGPPSWPSLPAEILQANPAFLDDNGEKTKGWYPSPPGEQHVRGIYLVQKRTVRVPFMETFDLPENSTSCPRREESIVAPQALALLNGPLAVEAARAFAGRVEREVGNDPTAQVTRAFRGALQRSPEPVEAEACLKLLRERSLPELCRALLNLNEFIFVD